uniref:U1-C C2H2-type zinc finger domain-containing protein n=1 Tax=Kalanchoe fedtschenkoi TaxID=63787 RepID=A0A7N0REH4_KALFE
MNMPRYYCDYCDTYLTHESVMQPFCAISKGYISLLMWCVSLFEVCLIGDWKIIMAVFVYVLRFLLYSW